MGLGVWGFGGLGVWGFGLGLQWFRLQFVTRVQRLQTAMAQVGCVGWQGCPYRTDSPLNRRALEGLGPSIFSIAVTRHFFTWLSRPKPVNSCRRHAAGLMSEPAAERPLESDKENSTATG